MSLASATGTVARWNRPLLVFAAAMTVLALVCAVGIVVDPRTLEGLPIWMKPFKFSVSFVLYAATLAWMLSLVRRPRARRLAGALAAVLVGCSTIEMAVIVTQVVRGTHSHFNSTTPINTVLWVTMGATITVLWVATAAVAVLLLRERALSQPMTWAVRLGLVVALVGLASGFFMLLPTPEQLGAAAATGQRMTTIGAHAVGVPDGGPGLPLLGWSTTGGDLRIGHFFGMHALQGLPLVALVLGALAARIPALRSERTRAGLVAVAGAGWLAVTILLTVQALRAQPLLAPDALTLGALGLIVVAVATAAALVVRRDDPEQAKPEAPTPDAPTPVALPTEPRVLS